MFFRGVVVVTTLVNVVFTSVPRRDPSFDEIDPTTEDDDEVLQGFDISQTEFPSDSISSSVSVWPSMTLWSNPGLERVPTEIFRHTGPLSNDQLIPQHLVGLEPTSRKSPTSQVYHISGFGNRWSITYSIYCPGEGDALIREKEIMQEVNAKAPGIVPRWLFTSAEGIVGDGVVGKITHANIVCKFHMNPRVRYIISERLWATLGAFIRINEKRFSIAEVGAIGLQMLRLVRHLHSIGIIHRNIHPSNFGITKTFRRKLVLIGLHKAEYSESIHDKDNDWFVGGAITPGGTLMPGLFSTSWEIQGYSTSYRDDVLRVLLCMAVAMFGQEYMEALSTLATAPKRHARRAARKHNAWKRSANFFDSYLPHRVSGSTVSFETGLHVRTVNGVTEANLLAVGEIMDTLMAVARAPMFIEQKPDYNRIEVLLTQLVRLTDPGADPNTLVNFRPSK